MPPCLAKHARKNNAFGLNSVGIPATPFHFDDVEFAKPSESAARRERVNVIERTVRGIVDGFHFSEENQRACVTVIQLNFEPAEPFDVIFA